MVIERVPLPCMCSASISPDFGDNSGNLYSNSLLVAPSLWELCIPHKIVSRTPFGRGNFVGINALGNDLPSHDMWWDNNFNVAFSMIFLVPGANVVCVCIVSWCCHHVMRLCWRHSYCDVIQLGAQSRFLWFDLNILVVEFVPEFWGRNRLTIWGYTPSMPIAVIRKWMKKQ